MPSIADQLPDYDAAAYGAGAGGRPTTRYTNLGGLPRTSDAAPERDSMAPDPLSVLSPFLSASDFLRVGRPATIAPDALDIDIGFNPTQLPIWPGARPTASRLAGRTPVPTRAVRRPGLPIDFLERTEVGGDSAGAPGEPGDAQAAVDSVTAAFSNPTGLGRTSLGIPGLDASLLGGVNARLGPVAVGITPFGSVGIRPNTDSNTLNLVLSTAAKLAGIPTGVSIAGLLGLGALAGPAALVLGGAFPLAVQLAESVAQRMGITTNAVDIANARVATQMAADPTAMAYGSFAPAVSPSALASALATLAQGGVISQATLDATSGLQAALSAARAPRFGATPGSPSSNPAGHHASPLGYVESNVVDPTTGLPVGAATGNAPPNSTNFGDSAGNTSGGTPGTGPSGAGQGGVTGTDAIDSGVAGSSPSSGGGGGDGGASGTVLVTWLHRRGHQRVTSKVKMDAIRLRQAFLRARPKTAPAMLRKYVSVSQRVIDAVERLPKREQAAYEERIYRAMVGPDGRLDPQDFVGAAERLTALLRDLTRELGVSVPRHHFEWDPRVDRTKELRHRAIPAAR